MANAGLQDRLRASLDEEASHLRAQLEDLAPNSSHDENFADSGQVAAEQGESRALAGQLQETLTDVEAALVKLDNGTYGLCETCGEAIAEPRLEAMPSTRYCINCASKR